MGRHRFYTPTLTGFDSLKKHHSRKTEMFIGKLDYFRIMEPEESFVGRPLYILLEPFGYRNDKVKDGYTVMCHRLFITDFASIPEWIPMNVKSGLWRHAAVIHDKACWLARNGEITMKQADDYFYYAMIEDGSNKIVAFTFWSVARIFHIAKDIFGKKTTRL